MSGVFEEGSFTQDFFVVKGGSGSGVGTQSRTYVREGFLINSRQILFDARKDKGCFDKKKMKKL